MTRVTVTIDTKSNARLFLEMLEALTFVKDIYAENVYEEELSKEDIKLLEERWANYIKNPKSAKTWKEVKQALTKKYGK